MKKSPGGESRKRFQISLRALLLFVGLVGVLGGLGCVYLRNHYLDSQFKNAAQVERYERGFRPSFFHAFRGGERQFVKTCRVEAEKLSVATLAPNLEEITIVGSLDTPTIIDDLKSIAEENPKLKQVELFRSEIKRQDVASAFSRLHHLDRLLLMDAEIDDRALRHAFE